MNRLSSNFFTPNKTRIPDPQNIFYKNNQVGGSNKNISIFSKEEVKKAAVPLTFFIVLSSVYIVMFVLYLTHRIRKVKNSDSIPNFDSSFDDNSDNSLTTNYSYSYSYYTYSEYSEK